MVTYDAAFYELEGQVARAAAEIVIPRILAETGAASVIDLGCGTGEWVRVADEHGCETMGLDWHVPAELIVAPTYIEWDLTESVFHCDGWDLAICVEVAEHLPDDTPLVDGLAGAGAVLFSAATPGQPGVGHINCRPHDYWHDQFATYGLDPTFVGDWFDEPVADFYRRNLYLYREGS